jgi:hypothetical protein
LIRISYLRSYRPSLAESSIHRLCSLACAPEVLSQLCSGFAPRVFTNAPSLVERMLYPVAPASTTIVTFRLFVLKETSSGSSKHVVGTSFRYRSVVFWEPAADLEEPYGQQWGGRCTSLIHYAEHSSIPSKCIKQPQTPSPFPSPDAKAHGNEEPKSYIIRPDPQNHISSPGNMHCVFQRWIYNIWLRIQDLVPSCWRLEGVVCAVSCTPLESVAGEEVEVMSVLIK